MLPTMDPRTYAILDEDRRVIATAHTTVDCMACDLYTVIDNHGDPSSDFVAELVTVLPPRGHAFHKLGILEQHYHSKLG